MIPRERAGTPPDIGAIMKGDDLRALLGRLESATGPDRDLDAALSAGLRCALFHEDADRSWHKDAVFVARGGAIIVADTKADPPRACSASPLPLTQSVQLRLALALALRALIARTEPSPDA